MGPIRSGRYASRKSPTPSGRAATITPCSFPWLVSAAILPSSRKRSRMVRDALEQLRQVSPQLAGDGGGGCYQIKLLRTQPLRHGRERIVQRQPELHLLDQQSELLPQRRIALAPDLVDGLLQRESSAQRVRHLLQPVH